MMTSQRGWLSSSSSNPTTPGSRAQAPVRLQTARGRSLWQPSSACLPLYRNSQTLSWLSPWLSPGSSPGTSAPKNSLRVRGRELKKIVSDHTLLFLGDKTAPRTGQCSPWRAPAALCRCVWSVPTVEVSLLRKRLRASRILQALPDLCLATALTIT